MMKSDEALLAAALAAQKNAYCPYSKFKVGAAVMTEDGSIFSGCNVENASYGSSLCAERSAVSAAVTAGHRRLTRVVVVAPISRPCGACRQVLYEFSDARTTILLIGRKSTLNTTIRKLLPEPFKPKALGVK
jgi:cytidine deaminase